ncbi:MAG TPA: hypothetical protein VFG89_05740 [Coriobacteriia bacterium]|nr:hypothetical protein [Coriobacteriia bacterium]
MRASVRLGLLLVLVGVLTVLGVGTAFAAIDDVYLASVNTAGGQGNQTSYDSDVSSDGRFVVFVSAAGNLVADDTNMFSDVFLRDRWKGTTVRLMGTGGVQPNGSAAAPSISDDGRYVAFESSASNLVAGDTNSVSDIFLSDTVTGAVLRVSTGVGGAAANGACSRPRISGDGKFVGYYSTASNLVASDSNGFSDVFLYNLALATTTRVSALANGTQANNLSDYCSLSYDGRYVSFSTKATNFGQLDLNNDYDLWRWDRTDGSLTPISLTPAGSLSNASCDYSEMSADGRYVSFRSYASDVVVGDTNGVADVFVRDMVIGSTQRVSMSTSGLQGNGDSNTDTAISGDGRYVAFYSTASTLVDADTNAAPDLFIRDRVANTTVRASVSATGAQANGSSSSQRLAASGRFLAFNSVATNLVAVDTNGFSDVFVKQLGTEPSLLTLTPSAMTPAYDASVTLAGSLKANSADGNAIPGATVVLQKFAGSAWADVASAVSGADGAVLFTVKPGVKTTYRLSYAGTPKAYDTITSAPVLIAPHPKVGTPVAPKSVKKSRYFSVYGSLKPKHSKGTKPVRIYKFKKVGTKWVSKGYVKAKAYNYKGYTRYKVRMRLTSKGSWRLQAYAIPDSKHSDSWSAKYDSVKVK